MIAIDEMVLHGILTEQPNQDEATNRNDESGRYRMPILRSWESDGDVPTYEGRKLVNVGGVVLADEETAQEIA